MRKRAMTEVEAGESKTHKRGERETERLRQRDLRLRAVLRCCAGRVESRDNGMWSRGERMERERREGPGESREYIVTWPRVKRAHNIRTRTGPHTHSHTAGDDLIPGSV